MSNSLPPYGLYPARLFCLCEFSRKNTGVGCHALLQVCYVYFTTIAKKIFLTKQNTCALCPVPPLAGPSGGSFHLGCNLLTSFRSLLQSQLLRETPWRPVKVATLPPSATNSHPSKHLPFPELSCLFTCLLIRLIVVETAAPTKTHMRIGTLSCLWFFP